MTDWPVRWWQSQPSMEGPAMMSADLVAILPLAAIEQHGPHLPLSTDLDIGMGLLTHACRLLPEDFPVRVLPPQAIGYSDEHRRYGGTLTLRPDLLVALIEETGDALAASGVKRLVLANSHGGNRLALDTAGLRLRDRHRMLVVKANWFRFPRPEGVDLPESEWKHGFHGGAVETSMMMFLQPDLVREDQIRHWPSLGEELEATLRWLGPEGAASFSWLAGDLNPSGAVGDARLATAALGERLVSHYATVLSEVIREARAFPIDRLS